MTNKHWICEVCQEPIEGESGAVVLTGAYPEGLRRPGAAVPLDIHVSHHACANTDQGYCIGVERARTAEDWLAWAIHLSEKTWFLVLPPDPFEGQPRFTFVTDGEIEERCAGLEEPRFRQFLIFWFQGHGLDHHKFAV